MMQDDAKRPMTRTEAAARPLFFALGWLFLVVGVAGVILPLLPGTVFLIMSAACFTRSSPRFESWLLNHPRLGPTVVAWRRDGVIPRRAKRMALSMMAVSFGITWAVGAPPIALVCTGAGLLAGAAYVASRPSERITPP